jgi:hypothetical protein
MRTSKKVRTHVEGCGQAGKGSDSWVEVYQLRQLGCPHLSRVVGRVYYQRNARRVFEEHFLFPLAALPLKVPVTATDASNQPPFNQDISTIDRDYWRDRERREPRSHMCARLTGLNLA